MSSAIPLTSALRLKVTARPWLLGMNTEMNIHVVYSHVGDKERFPAAAFCHLSNLHSRGAAQRQVLQLVMFIMWPFWLFMYPNSSEILKDPQERILMLV